MGRALVGGAILAIAACGGADFSPATAFDPGPTSTHGTPPPSTAQTTSSTTSDPVQPAVLALSSGRGDDGSFEVAAWLASDPFQFADHRIIVGADVDEDHPGVGDPVPFLDGHLVLTPEETRLVAVDGSVADGDEAARLVSWGWADGILRVFFIGSTPARGGTTWVIVEVDGEAVAGGVAGASFGMRCSHHTAGLALTPEADARDVPDAGVVCRYPSG